MFLLIWNQYFFRFNSAAMETGLTAKVFCYANMNVTLFRVSANQISVFSITQQSRLLLLWMNIMFDFICIGLCQESNQRPLSNVPL